MSTGEKIVAFEICKTETLCQICLRSHTIWTKINSEKIYTDLAIGHKLFLKRANNKEQKLAILQNLEKMLKRYEM